MKLKRRCWCCDECCIREDELEDEEEVNALATTAEEAARLDRHKKLGASSSFSALLLQQTARSCQADATHCVGIGTKQEQSPAVIEKTE